MIIASSSPYSLDGPMCISFSGGRSSAYMLYQILQAHGGQLPDDVVVCFANTGKEMPQTLDFVQACSEQWGVTIVWLELSAVRLARQEGSKKFEYKTRVADYATASRNGEPFEALIKARQYLPNPVARFCTADLKVRRINDYLRGLGWDEWDTAVGIRADEPRRAHKMLGKSDNGEHKVLPLYWAGVTKETVAAYWKAQPFDLQLPNNNGTTDWGNCDLCFLKGAKKKLSIIREKPELADWWAAQERDPDGIEILPAYHDDDNKPHGERIVQTGGMKFRNDQPSYAQMQAMAEEQYSFDFDDSISCFCGD